MPTHPTPGTPQLPAVLVVDRAFCILLLLSILPGSHGCSGLQPDLLESTGIVSVTATARTVDPGALRFDWCVSNGTAENLWLFSLGYTDTPAPHRNGAWARFEPVEESKWLVVASKSSRVLATADGVHGPGSFSSQNLAEPLKASQRLCGIFELPLFSDVDPQRVAGGQQGPVLKYKDPWGRGLARPRFVAAADADCLVEVGVVTETAAMTLGELPIASPAGHLIGSPTFSVVQRLIRSPSFPCAKRR